MTSISSTGMSRAMFGAYLSLERCRSYGIQIETVVTVLTWQRYSDMKLQTVLSSEVTKLQMDTESKMEIQ